ncbi:MAG: ribosome maturation factor RimP [Pseudomonadota bacterium]
MGFEQLEPITDDEPRIVVETGVDAKVASIIEPVLNGEGYRLVRVRLSGMNGLTLQIMAERADGTMTVEDCEQVSRMISPLLDVEDPIDKAYHLEMSSPGIDRPLVRKSDFAKWRGHICKLETSVMVNGRKRFRGTITDVTPEAMTLFRDQPAIGEDNEHTIPFEVVADARLILTDDLIRASLKADKAAREARGETTDGGDIFPSDETEI